MPPKRNRKKKKDGQQEEAKPASSEPQATANPQPQEQVPQPQQSQQKNPTQKPKKIDHVQEQSQAIRPSQQKLGPEGPSRQQQVPQQQGPPQQQAPRPQGPPQQQGPRPQGPPQQQGPRPQGPPQQQGPRPQQPPQQQVPPPQWGPPQQQVPPQWGPPQQQAPRPQQPPQQQAPRPQGPPQQQAPRPQGPPQQQAPRPQGPPQQQAAPQWGLPQQQVPPPQWGPPQQQAPRPQGPPQQQAPRPQGPPQQQAPRPQQPPQQQAPRPQQPPQQQAPRPQGPPQQQAPRPQGPPQQQAPRPQGPPQQQAPRSQGPPQQQAPRPQGPPQQQAPQQQQLTAAAGDQPQISPAKTSLSSAMVQKYVAMIPKRTDPMKCGTKGRKITVETNMFSLVPGRSFCPKVIHYDVTIDPDKPKFMMRPVFEALRKKAFPNRNPAFDGRKNAYSGKELPFGTRIHEKVSVFNTEKQKDDEFDITMKKANEVDLSWLSTLKPGSNNHEQILIGTQALDVILHHGPSSYLVPVGRSLFHPPQREPVYLQNAMELWYGTFMSAIAGWKPYLNIDVSHKAFPTSQSVIDTMKELCGINFNSAISFADVSRNKFVLSKYLKGLKVQHEIPGKPNTKRTHRIIGLVEVPAKSDTFTTSDGKQYTVVQYFKEQHGYNIVFPDLPCLWVGSVNKKNHIPVELCLIAPGQVVQRKMDPTQTSQMIRHAATNTEMRKKKIMEAFNAVRLNQQPTLKDEFGLSVDANFTVVPARVLQAPSLQYDKPVEPRKGTWWAGRFAKPASLDDSCWTFLNLNRRTQDNDLYDFQRKLQEHGPKLAMRIGKSLTPFTHLNPQDRNFKKCLVNAFDDYKKKNLQLVIVILPFGLDDAYHIVKQCSELGASVLTQCVKCETLRKLSDSTLGNILQKVNAKLNGINHSFTPAVRPRCLSQPCILIGADVTHPSPDAKDIPSIAAVAASHDSKAFQYNVQVRLQPARMEVIQDLENIIVEQIKFFKEKTAHLPRNVIFYRDGVSEGQFPQIMHYEIGAMKRAFKRIDATYQPLITFLVVQKRHHTRLFPTDKRNSDDRNFNVQAGTIVDTHITHPSHIDFYLVSHASIQGTARPTKYRCLFNEIGMSEDDIEELTYYLCHMFARCTRSVSYPAPTYYAHLAAFRGRTYIHAQDICMSRLEEEQKKKLVIRLLHDNPMFFV